MFLSITAGIWKLRKKLLENQQASIWPLARNVDEICNKNWTYRSRLHVLKLLIAQKLEDNQVILFWHFVLVRQSEIYIGGPFIKLHVVMPGVGLERSQAQESK